MENNRDYKEITLRTRSADHHRILQSFLSLIVGNFHDEHGPLIVTINDAITRKDHRAVRKNMQILKELVEEYSNNLEHTNDLVDEYIVLGRETLTRTRFVSGESVRSDEFSLRMKQSQEEAEADKEEAKKRVAKKKPKKSSVKKSSK